VLREIDFLLKNFVDRYDCVAFVESSCLGSVVILPLASSSRSPRSQYSLQIIQLKALLSSVGSW